MSQQCYQIAIKPSLEAFPLASSEIEPQGARLEPVEEVQTLQLSEDKTVRVGTELEPDVKRSISKVLTQYSKSFASEASEIVGVDPQVASHSLNILSGSKPVVQKKRKFAYERQKLIAEETKKLLDAGFI